MKYLNKIVLLIFVVLFGSLFTLLGACTTEEMKELPQSSISDNSSSIIESSSSNTSTGEYNSNNESSAQFSQNSSLQESSSVFSPSSSESSTESSSTENNSSESSSDNNNSSTESSENQESANSSSSTDDSSSSDSESSSGGEAIDPVDPILPPHEHSFIESILLEPTCLEEGTMLLQCEDCEVNKTEPIGALGHMEEPILEIPATCLATGLSEGVRCARCETVLTEQEETPIVDHQYHSDFGICIWCDLTKLEYQVTTNGLEKYALVTRPVGLAHRVVIPSTYEINGEVLPVRISLNMLDKNELSDEKALKLGLYSLEIGEGVKAEKGVDSTQIFSDCYNLIEVFNASEIDFGLTTRRYTGQTVSPLYYVEKTENGYISKVVKDSAGNLSYTGETVVDGFKSRVHVDENGYILYTDGEERIFVGYNRREAQHIHLQIPEGVTKIKSYALHTCNTISSVTIPSSVSVIERFAFDGHSIPASVYMQGNPLWCVVKDSTEQFNYNCEGVSEELLWNDFTKKSPYGYFEYIWKRETE